MFVTRNVRMKYMKPAGGEGSDNGGTGTGTGEGGSAGGSGEGAGAGGEGEGAGSGAAGGEGAGAKKPTDEEARLLKENMKRKEELRKKDEELTTLRKQFEGIDPNAVRKLLDDQKKAEDAALEAKGDYDRLKARMAEEHAKQVKTLQDQIAELQGQVGKAGSTISELTVGTQFGQSTFIADELTLTPAKARVIYGDHFEIEDGKVVGYDKPRGSAGRTALVDQYGTAVPFDAALRKIVEADPEKDHLLKSKVKAGADSASRTGGKSGEQQKEAPTDSVSRIAAGLKGLKIA